MTEVDKHSGGSEHLGDEKHHGTEHQYTEGRRHRIGLIGNPNSGKTTLFNALTGSHQKVGNWPGVTVEKKVGRLRYHGHKIEIVDLPGLYSLDTYADNASPDEQVARQFLLSGEVDAVINIIDASNVERNLFLTTQLLEMQVPVIVVLNMMDVAQKQGMVIDTEKMSKALGCPVFAVVASQQKGIDALLACITGTEKVVCSLLTPQYPQPLIDAIEKVVSLVTPVAQQMNINARWMALKALESDGLTLKMLDEGQQKTVRKVCHEVEETLGDEIDIVTADARYTLIGSVVESIVARPNLVSQSTSEKIDSVILNRILGIPIFLFVMYLMFVFTIVIGGLFNDFFEGIFAVFFVDGLSALLDSFGAPEWTKVVFAQGMGGGIATVASFIPIIGCLFIFLSLLEDSGYMSRAAFVMDRFMRLIGLPGKSFVPLIVGFGCNVPAIMATRTLENHRDRLMTIAMAPFMSCGARMPIFALFAIAFFPVGGQNIVFLLYLLGIVAAILTGLALKYTLLPGKGAPFVMELPPYHIPTLKGIGMHTWENLKGFILRAGQVIVPMVMVINVINSIGVDGSFGHSDTEESVLSSIGKTITPVFKPMGLTEENWPASVGIFTGLLAKEAVVGTLNALYEKEASALNEPTGSEEEEVEAFDLWKGIVAAYQNIPDKIAELKDNILDPLGMAAAEKDEGVQATPKDVMVSMFKTKTAALSYLILVLLYFPCFAVVGTVAREAGKRWALFVAVWTSAFAYCASVLFYQIATFSQHPGYSMAWIGGIVIFAVLSLYMLRRMRGAVPAPVMNSGD